MRYNRTPDTTPEPGWTWRKSGLVGLGTALFIIVATGIFFLSRIGMAEKEAVVQDTRATLWEAPRESYNQPSPAPAAAATSPEQQELQAATQQAAKAEPPPLNEAIVAARAGGFGKYEPAEDKSAGSEGGFGGGGCRLPAGTKIHGQMETASTSTNAGGVTARIPYEVLGEGGCSGIKAGAMMVGMSEKGADFGAERSNFIFHTIEQDGVAVNLADAAAAADPMGMGGVPGDVDRHTGMIATRVGLATLTGVLDAAAASVVGYYGIPMQQSSRAIDNWANQAIELDPTLTTDPSKRRSDILIILQKPIML